MSSILSKSIMFGVKNRVPIISETINLMKLRYLSTRRGSRNDENFLSKKKRFLHFLSQTSFLWDKRPTTVVRTSDFQHFAICRRKFVQNLFLNTFKPSCDFPNIYMVILGRKNFLVKKSSKSPFLGIQPYTAKIA